MDKYADIFINELIYKSLEGDISEDETRILNEFVSKPENVAYYTECLRLYSAMNNRARLSADTVSDCGGHLGFEELAFYGNAPSSENQEEVCENDPVPIYATSKRPKINNFTIFTFISSAAAVLMVVLFISFIPMQSEYHAVIIDSFNTQWADTSKPNGVGSELNSTDGQRWLQSGFVKMLFECGAEVLIQSPARFEIVSGKRLNVLSGKSYSKVPERATGFTIDTPDTKVIDLGTEFGLEVFGGSSSVHMVEGKAQVIPQKSLSTEKPIELTAGNAKSVDKNGITSDIRLEDKKFVRDVSSDMQMIYRGDKPVLVGSWSQRLTEDINKDLRNDGYLVEAVNFAGRPDSSVTIGGISFGKSPNGQVIAGGTHLLEKDVSVFTDLDEGLLPLLTTGKMLDNSNTGLRIYLDALEPGQAYRLQLILGFPWHWTDVNCYGINGEHMYFPNKINKPNIGIATYYWKPQSLTEKIELTSPVPESGEWNSIFVFGYALHKVD